MRSKVQGLDSSIIFQTVDCRLIACSSAVSKTAMRAVVHKSYVSASHFSDCAWQFLCVFLQHGARPAMTTA